MKYNDDKTVLFGDIHVFKVLSRSCGEVPYVTFDTDSLKEHADYLWVGTIPFQLTLPPEKTMVVDEVAKLREIQDQLKKATSKTLFELDCRINSLLRLDFADAVVEVSPSLEIKTAPFSLKREDWRADDDIPF